MISDPYIINPHNAYSMIIKEYFDITDKRTRETLLSVNEADQTQILASLASKLYKSIMANVTDIDYGKIPASKGDITQIPNYQEMIECLETVGNIISNYNETPESVNTIQEAIENIKDSKRIWEKAFGTKCEIPMVFYSTIVLAIISSTSLIISTSVDFVNDPGNKSYKETLDKNRLHKSKESLLLKNLRDFNKAYKKKEVEKTMTSLLKAQKAVHEEGVVEIFKMVIGGVVLTLTMVKMILLIFPILHELTSMFYGMKQSISDYFYYQSNVVALNAEKAKMDMTKTPEEREKIYKKQVKTAEKLRKLSNTFAIKFKKGETVANKIIKDSDKPNYKIDDVVEEEPDSSSKIF
ncbi:MAG: hypothetical protein PHC62_00695 [Candidatus Izemoplasmatales bacterium]|nr:hypothetical protein [Candidatus Izemoplasmatales bacterium]